MGYNEYGYGMESLFGDVEVEDTGYSEVGDNGNNNLVTYTLLVNAPTDNLNYILSSAERIGLKYDVALAFGDQFLITTSSEINGWMALLGKLFKTTEFRCSIAKLETLTLSDDLRQQL